MRKLILTLSLLLTIQFVSAETPVLTIEYKYSNASDTTHLQIMKSDNDFCCNFVVLSTPSDSLNSNVTLIRHTQTGVVLGKIYGKPSKEFVMKICQTYGYLDRNHVDKLATEMLKNKQQ